MNQTLCLGGISPSQLGRERASPAGAGRQHQQQASVSAEEVRGKREATEGSGAEAEGAWTSGLIVLSWGCWQTAWGWRSAQKRPILPGLI